MLFAKIYFDLDRDCILSELTQNSVEPFYVSQEKVHDDEMITLVIDAGDQQRHFLERLRESHQVTHAEAIDDTRLLLTKRSCGALPVIRSNHGMLQGMDMVNGSQRVFNVVVFRREDLRTIMNELDEIGSVRLGKLLPHTDRTASLSARQSEVIEAALDAGYFDWPRRTDAQTLANQLGIAHSTLLEHLRKAEKKLIEVAVSDVRTPEMSTPDERKFVIDEPI
ncbi:helix-turn-helix domain-containing protein [Haladaptatus sp. NG-SE-30]